MGSRPLHGVTSGASPVIGVPASHRGSLLNPRRTTGLELVIRGPLAALSPHASPSSSNSRRARLTNSGSGSVGR
jgi:hypothetical protein